MKHWIGIDVSKAKLDAALLDDQGKRLAEEQVTNTERGLKGLLRRWTKAFALAKDKTMACLEPTSYYSNLPLEVLVGQGMPTWLANPMDLKQSIGMTRGKNDRIDALRIADYARRHHDKARLISADGLKLSKVKQLLSRRAHLVERRGVHQRNFKEVNALVSKELRPVFDRIDQDQIEVLTKAILEIDGMIQDTIQSEPELNERYKLLLSIPGIGPVLAAHLLAVTHGFRRFNNARQLSCHAGCAPFEKRSGSSIRGRTQVSNKADHTLKRLLHISVLGLIRFPGEFRDYYQRKTGEGKHALLVLNALRNKLIHRVFAVLERGTPFTKQPTRLQMS